MGLQKNIVYSAVLTCSTYLVPLLVFPYISRVLGVDGIGAVDFVDSVINYCVLLSMMGMTTLGVREIARNKSNPVLLQQAFADLFSLNLLSTLVVLFVLALMICLVPQLWDKKELFCIGAIKLVANLFWIEWFFKGIENFRYITIRSVVLRLLFICFVYLLVHEEQDYGVYYFLFVSLILGNAIFNWNFRKRYIGCSLRHVDIKRYAKPFFRLGGFAVLSSVYTQLITVWLGLQCGETEVGYYTTSTRLHQVIIALFSTLTSVIIPRMSVLFKENRLTDVRQMTEKAFQILFLFAFPVFSFMEFFASDLISLIAGPGFEAAVFPMRIVVFQVFIIGTEQICILQILIPMQKEREILRAAICGVSVCLLGGGLLIPQMHSMGAALTWFFSELAVMLVALHYVKAFLGINFPFAMFCRYACISLPYVLGAITIFVASESGIGRLVWALAFFLCYAIVCEEYVLRIHVLSTVWKKMRKK